MNDFQPLMGAGKHAQILQEQQVFPTAEPAPATPQPPPPSYLRLRHCDSRFWRTLIRCWHGGGGKWESARFLGDHEQSLEPAARLGKTHS